MRNSQHLTDTLQLKGTGVFSTENAKTGTGLREFLQEACPRFLVFCGKHTRPPVGPAVRAIAILMISLAIVSLSAQGQRPTQADSVVRLLTDIENAISSSNTEEFMRLTAATLPTADMTALVSSLLREKQTS